MRRDGWLVASGVAVIFFAVALIVVPAAPSAAADEAAKDGKTVFLEQKCNLCHAIQSQAVERKVKSSKAPDLSNVGSERDAAWIERWLKKEELLHGKKHEKNYQGSDADRATVAAWLATLKQAKG